MEVYKGNMHGEKGASKDRARLKKELIVNIQGGEVKQLLKARRSYNCAIVFSIRGHGVGSRSVNRARSQAHFHGEPERLHTFGVAEREDDGGFEHHVLRPLAEGHSSNCLGVA